MPTVSVDGRTICYEETGSGEPILWIQGTGESKAGWVGQTMEFSERYRCVAIDNRDVGESSSVEEPYRPADMAADVAGVGDHLATGPAHVVGYSLGGAIAQELALARPDLVRSLTLLSTWATSDEWFKAQMRGWQSIRRAHRDDEEAFLRALWPWIWSAKTFATPGLVDGFTAFALAEEPRQPPEGFIRQADADIAHDAAARLGQVSAPTLVIVGEEDICTPPRYSRELCRLIAQAELVTIPEAGHGAVFERPDLVNAAIAGFLAKH